MLTRLQLSDGTRVGTVRFVPKVGDVIFHGPVPYSVLEVREHSRASMVLVTVASFAGDPDDILTNATESWYAE